MKRLYKYNEYSRWKIKNFMDKKNFHKIMFFLFIWMIFVLQNILSIPFEYLFKHIPVEPQFGSIFV